MKYTLKVLTAATIILCLASCSPETNPKSPEIGTSQTQAPAFTANGSEPFWDMKWNSKTVVVTIGIEKETVILSDIKSIKTNTGWVLSSKQGVDIKVLQSRCLDLAGNPNDFEVSANVSDIKLVGCGNKTP